MFISALWGESVQWAQLPAYFIGEFVGAVVGAFAYLTLAKTRPAVVIPEARLTTRIGEEVPA
jgi:glycerol uptake facilitator-like aquaporin